MVTQEHILKSFVSGIRWTYFGAAGAVGYSIIQQPGIVSLSEILPMMVLMILGAVVQFILLFVDPDWRSDNTA